MQIVQIVLDKKLLHAADQAAKRARQTIPLRAQRPTGTSPRVSIAASEERDRQGYSRLPQARAEARGWESEATWPEE